MAEYIEREALRAFPIRADHCDKEHANEHFIYGIETVLEYAENLPAADVAPVVRCKDCVNGNTDRGFFLCCSSGMVVNADDFCSYGERKTNGL